MIFFRSSPLIEPHLAISSSERPPPGSVGAIDIEDAG
jgi:hypothetical protein